MYKSVYMQVKVILKIKYRYFSIFTYLYASLASLSDQLNVAMLYVLSEKLKRDKFCDAAWKNDAWQVAILKETSQFIEVLHERLIHNTLKSQTTLAIIITLSGAAKPAEHLLQNETFDSVLLGKVSPDPKVGRFGWWRQLNGANFFISCTQLMEAEKKIRTLNTVQLDIAKERNFGLAFFHLPA